MTRDSLPQIRPLKKGEGLILAGPASELRKLAAAASGSLLFCAHVGPSMNPTLHESDLLEIARPDGRSLRPGDVILFVPPAGDQAVVHRVIEATAEGFRTRGDNNDRADPWLVVSEDILGQVVAAWRGERRRKIAGGRQGRMVARVVRLQRAGDRVISRLLHPFYDSLARAGFVRRVLPSRLRPRVVTYRAEGQLHVRLILGRRAIGHYNPHTGRWHVNRPYRLLVDERALPLDPENWRTQ